MAAKVNVLVFFLMVIASGVNAKLVTLSNTLPRLDTNGNILDAHDGNIIQWNGTGDYFYYSLGYGSCQDIYTIINGKGTIYCKEFMNNSTIENQICGFEYNQTINLYTSSDLNTWEYHGNILPIDQRPFGIYLTPTVTYNPIHDEYVLYVGVWQQPINYTFQSVYMAATSKSKYGPFKIMNEYVNVTNPHPGDAKLFTDSDTGKGYLVYTTTEQTAELNHSIVVELLSDDYLYSTGMKSKLLNQSGQQLETPTLFKNIYNGLYYLTASHICCYCTKGSIVMVFVSDNILGPYHQMIPTPYINDINANGDDNQSIIIHAQQTNIFLITTLDENNKINYQYIWLGNRWQSSPDKTKGHDFTVWIPLNWTNDSIQTMKWYDNFTLNLV